MFILKHKYNKNWLNTRMGFFTLMVVLFWLKNLLAYTVDFNLGIESFFQYVILFISPVATTVFLFSAALYIKSPKKAYITLLIISSLTTLLLFSNVIYYREFTDFITVNTMLGAGKVASGLGESALRMFRPYDLLYWIDIIVVIVLLATKKIKIDERPIAIRSAFAVTSFSILLFSANLTLAETDRPELLKRTFSRDHIVKYLGMNVFTVYDGVQTYNATQRRAQASQNDLVDVQKYVKTHYAKPNDDMFGIAKGRNVIYVHLESFQQFLIDYKLKDENGVEHEVTPFLNSLFHSNETFSFDNAFHQVGSGKTSDAETLLENSFFGLSQGPLFTQLGDKNTFQSAPNILGQTQGYTSVAFHGNGGSFWNRNETYKHLGYNYFFDGSYYDVNENNSFQYGLHDKPFLAQSIKYLEHVQQPFYSKFILVSNHYPYAKFKDDNAGFPMANTSDATINGYFATANYLDTAVKEFFDYLKASGLYDNSVIVLYGDHYGISNSRNKSLAELLGKSKEEWNDFDDTAVQRVPVMFHVPGQTKGGINHTFGGQVDVLPTLLHLLGVDTQSYIQLGQDFFSKDKDQIVAFRNGTIVTPKYTILGETVYDTKTGELIDSPTEEQLTEIADIKEKGTTQLNMSDAITNGDLLRFNTNSGLKPLDPAKFDYKNELDKLLQVEQQKGDKSTSLYSLHNNQSTVDLFKTQTYKEIQEEKGVTTQSSGTTETSSTTTK
ncbi:MULTISPECIES: LTA synthase family protein [Vagococcus]|uniref:LTA synthase family protein n=1 Tax=Vagococcus TaxID=2737 RepID=UPI000E4EE9A2|nr:LTA synthase family protein [Vagococcus sp. AM17-17]RHH71241.1 LTA synthase family protein [Vagococcus sp. AM17-17]